MVTGLNLTWVTGDTPAFSLGLLTRHPPNPPSQARGARDGSKLGRMGLDRRAAGAGRACFPGRVGRDGSAWRVRGAGRDGGHGSPAGRNPRWIPRERARRGGVALCGSVCRRGCTVAARHPRSHWATGGESGAIPSHGAQAGGRGAKRGDSDGGATRAGGRGAKQGEYLALERPVGRRGANPER